MNVYHSLTEVPKQKRPVSLCIGMFDGVHLGHKHLVSHITSPKGSSVVLTFSNHPKGILVPDAVIPTLMSPEEKVKALHECGVDTVILLPFSKDIAQMTYQMFLKEVYTATPFENLYLGENDALGKNREGNITALKAFGRDQSFRAHSVPKLVNAGNIVSSTWIRRCLYDGDIETAEKLLGRAVSFRTIDKGLIKSGSYKVRVLQDGLDRFINKTITIDENRSFTLDYPSTITFIS